MGNYKQKCEYCRENFYDKFKYSNHLDFCESEYYQKEREKKKKEEDEITSQFWEFTEVGFTEEQARLLIEKFGFSYST